MPVFPVVFHAWTTRLTDGKETARGAGDPFLQSVREACSLPLAGENNTPQPANFICCHPPPKHSGGPPRRPTVHGCTPVKRRLVVALSRAEKLSPPTTFSLSLHFSCRSFKVKINQKHPTPAVSRCSHVCRSQHKDSSKRTDERSVLFFQVVWERLRDAELRH